MPSARLTHSARVTGLVRTILPLLLCGLLPGLPLAQAPPFGASTLLERLWTAQELQGSPQEARLVRLRPPDRRPPARLAPLQQQEVLPRLWQASIRRIKPDQGQKVVALTFDLCERADAITGYDAQIVQALRATQVRATFFAGGKWMQSHPERAMQLMADPLFEVGNHGWTHGNLRLLTGQRLQEQIVWAQAQYELLWETLQQRVQRLGLTQQEMAHIPRLPRTFRFPYGTCSPAALQTLAAQGLAAIQWDIVSGDPVQGQSRNRLVHTVLQQVQPGSIVVFHANGRGYGTAEALPGMVTALRQRGYTFVTVSELLRSGEVIATPDCYEVRPGDNRRYDTLFGAGTGS